MIRWSWWEPSSRWRSRAQIAQPSPYRVIRTPYSAAATSNLRPRAESRKDFQVDPATIVDDWSDDRIWTKLRARVATAGATIKDGPIFR
jgi:hypothetical protein